MTAAGKLVFELTWDGARIARARVRSLRFHQAAGVLEGKTWEQALDSLPMLFSVCGRAQCVAAATALEAALDRRADVQVCGGRDAAVLLESLEEQLWRVLLDLPTLLGEPPPVAAFAALRRRLEEGMGVAGRHRWWNSPRGAGRLGGTGLREVLHSQVYGQEPEQWLALSLAQLGSWMDKGETLVARALRQVWQSGMGRSSIGLLPSPKVACLLERLEPAMARIDDFASLPQWEGEPAETGALSRRRSQPHVKAVLEQQGNTVAARLVARLVDLAMLAGSLQAHDDNTRPMAMGVSPAPGVGASHVETARGALLHHVTLRGECVERYRIIAPTEWNFHPRGAFVRGLEGWPAAKPEEARAAADWLCHALDPCVPHEVAVNHA